FDFSQNECSLQLSRQRLYCCVQLDENFFVRKVVRWISGNRHFRQRLHREGKLFLQSVDAHVPRDGKEPGRKPAARRIERGQFLKGRDKNVLADFFRAVAVPYKSSNHAENG